eukprot:snap_masked-scaffold_37-processed-gene-1.13-mRNA-1 protein AED:1.00 eAED:1.00 QI:0/0/0/0/1/1/2/0/87
MGKVVGVVVDDSWKSFVSTKCAEGERYEGRNGCSSYLSVLDFVVDCSDSPVSHGDKIVFSRYVLSKVRIGGFTFFSDTLLDNIDLTN